MNDFTVSIHPSPMTHIKNSSSTMFLSFHYYPENKPVFVQRCIQVQYVNTFLVSVEQIGTTGHLPSVEIQHHRHGSHVFSSEVRPHLQVRSRLDGSTGISGNTSADYSCS